MMPYYHIYIDQDGDEVEEQNLSKEQLMKYVVKPHNQRKKFMCKGTIVDPSEITTIRIIETEQLSSELLPQIKAEKAREGILAIFSSDIILLEDRGRDVTREFIKLGTRRPKKKLPRTKKSIPPSKRVFIVHGRDHKPMKELKTMLRKFGLSPIVLHEQPSGSRTIVEKLEKYSDVGYAFVILTPDDLGTSDEHFNKYNKNFVEELAKFRQGKQTEDETQRRLAENVENFIKNRARQNVILEFGYFIGKLDRDGVSGRDRVCCLLKGDVERPSDMHGIVYISFKESINDVRDKIVKELKAAGYKVKTE